MMCPLHRHSLKAHERLEDPELDVSISASGSSCLAVSLLYVDTNQISQRPPALPSPQSTEVDDRPVISPSYRGCHHRSIPPVKREEFKTDLKLHQGS